MADLCLPDAVNAPEALLNPIGIPGKVVVHHQVGSLKIDAFAGCVGGEEDLHIGIKSKRLLRFEPLFSTQASVDDDH